MGLFSGIGKFFKNILGDIIGFLIGVDFDDFDNDNKGTLLNTESNVAPIPVIYGKRRIGGTRVFIATGPATKTGNVDANTYLYVCLVLCEGEINLIRNDTGIYIDDELVSFTGTGATLTSGSGTRIGTRIKMQRFYGKDDGSDASGTITHSTLLAEHPDWTSSHQLKGVAYLALRFEYDQDVFRSIPTVNAIVFGRKVYDPALSATTYSANPALILRDYLTNERFGKGLPSSAIDDTSFTAAKNHLDTTTIEWDYETTTFSPYAFGCRIDTNKTVFNNVKELLQGMRGLLPYREGKYYLLIDKAEVVDSSNFQLTPNNITSDIAVQQAGKKQRYNRVIGKFVNPEANWQLDTAMWPEKGDTDYDDYLEEDNGEELIKEITVNTMIRYSAVRDLCRVILEASRKNVNAVQLTATSEAIDVAVGDIVVLEHPSLGWTGAAKQNMRVVDTQVTDDGEVKLSLVEYNSSIYPFVPAGAPPDNLSTDLPDMTEAPAPTNLTATETTALDGDGKVVPSVDLSWTAADTAFVEEYHVVWKKSTAGVYTNKSTTVNTSLDIFNLEFNPDNPVTYEFAVRTRNTAGVYSDYVTTTEVINGDDTPPANVTNLAARGDYEGIVVSWTNPDDSDFSYTEIHAVASNTEPAESATPTTSVMGEQFIEGDLAPGTQKYYFARTVDRSGNKSDYSTAVTATATDIRIKNLGLLLNQNAYPTDLNVSEIKEGEEYEVLTLGTTSTFGWGGLGSQGTVGDVFTATRDGNSLDGTGTVEHTSYVSDSGELAIVGLNLDGTLRYGQDGSIVWNGKQIDINHDNHNDFTALTNLSGKQGWIGFDRNKTAPFDMSGTLPSINVGFVYYEDGQWYYDDDSANPVSFNPDSFTGTTTGTDGTTTARIVALGTLKTGSSADSIAEGGLFSDPLDLRTVELPENFVDVTKIATQLESDNYSQDSAGWKIERSGDVEFNNITARGEIHAESGTIASTVTIGGTEIGDIESMVNGSLALYINKDAGQTTANGEGALVGVARDGTPVNDSDGFIIWDGSKITIESDQLTSTASFATQVQNQRGFIVFDVNKSNPFDISAGTVQSIDVAFAYKIDDQWYYDDNTTATPTSGQTFDPENTTGAEFVALGWLETGSSDVIKYGGLYGQPVALTLAAFPSDALESGTIGGISISNNKLYEGVGAFKNANTGFYLDSSGDFSLKDKLSFDNSAGELIVDGTVRADVIDIVDGNLYGDVEASSVAPGQVGIDQVSEAVYNEIKRRFINSKDGFYFTDTDSVDGTSVYTYITTGDLGSSALTTEPIELEAVFTYRFSSTTNYSTTNRQFFARFEWSSNGTSWSTVSVSSEVLHTVTQTQTEFGYVYEYNEVQRETVTLPSNYGYLRLTIQLASSSGQCFSEQAMAVSFVADQAGLIIGSAATTGEAQFPDGVIVNSLKYPESDGTSGQVIVTDGSGNLSFSTVSGSGNFLTSDADDTMDGILTVGGTSVSGAEGGEIRLTKPPTTNLAGDVSVDLYSDKIRFFENGGNARGAYIDITDCGNSATSEIWHSGNDGAGSGLAADTLDGFHAAQTSGDWFGHIPKVDSNGNMEIGRFTDWHYTDTSTASYDARSEILSTGVLRHTTAYGYIDLGPSNSSYAHITTDRSRFYFNKKLIVDEGIILSYNEDLQLGAGYGGSTAITVEHGTTNVAIGHDSTGFNSFGLPLIVGDGTGRAGITIFSAANDYGSIHFADTETTGGGSYAGYINYNQNNARMTFGTNATNRMYIDNTGRVGIGAVPGYAFQRSGLTNAGIAFTSSAFLSDDQANLPNGRIFYNGSRLVYDSPASGHRFSVVGSESTNIALDITRGRIDLFNDGQTGYTHSRIVTNSANSARGSGHFMHNSASDTEWYMGRPYNTGDAWQVSRRGTATHQDNTADTGYALLTINNSGDVIVESGGDLSITSGYLGVNTTSYGGRLHVKGDAYTRVAIEGTSGGHVAFYKGASEHASIFSDADGDIYFRTGSLLSDRVIIDSDGNVGINDMTPNALFHVNGTARFDHSETQGFRTTATDTVCDQTFYGHYLVHNMSGSDACTADRNHYGLYMDVNSSATGGDTSNEHRVYGIYSDVRVTGDSDLVYAGYNYARADHSSGTISYLRGGLNSGMAHNAAGTVTNVYGGVNIAYDFSSGTGAVSAVYGAQNHALAYSTSPNGSDNFFASYNLTQITGTQNQNISSITGTYSEVQIDSNSNTFTISNAYVYRAEYDYNDGDDSITVSTGYLYYGNYNGTLPTNAYGVYIADEVKNYFRGTVGIGTSTSIHTNLEINTPNRLGSSFTGTTDGEGLAVNQDNYVAGNYVSLVEGSYLTSQRNPNVRIGAKYTGSGSSLAFGTSNSYASGITNLAMQIDPDGHVGIGTAPAATFDVYTPSLGRTLLQYNNTSYNYFDVNNHFWRTAGEQNLMILTGTYMSLYLNAGSPSHSFNYNENGGEINLYSNTGASGTLIDLTSGSSRFISTVNGHNVQIGCGGANTTGRISFMKAGFGSVVGEYLADGKFETSDVSSTNGSVIIQGRYSGTHVLATFGTFYSSGAPMIGYGVRPNNGGGGTVSSASNFAFYRSSIEISPDFVYKASSSSVSTAVGSSVSMSEKFRVTKTGVATLGVGTAADTGYFRIWYGSSGTMDLYGFGIQFNRGSNYLRPTTDGNKTLYIGNSDASYDWSSIHFRSVNGLYMTGTQFLTSGRALVNITGVASSGDITTLSELGVGTSNPNFDVDIQGSAPVINLNSTSTSPADIRFQYSGGNAARIFVQNDEFHIQSQGFNDCITTKPARTDILSSDTYIQSNTRLGATSQVRINSSSSTAIFEGASTNYVLRHTGGVTMSFQLNGSTERYLMNTARLAPGADNTYALGSSTRRWSDVFSAGGVTTSSDERLKQQIRDIDDAERRVAVAAKGLLKAYKYNDAVEKKGDGARWHIGIIAQELKAAFEAEGLDAHEYGMFMYTEVWEAQEWIVDVDSEEGGWYTTKTWETEAEAPSHAVRKDEYAIRYQELLAFIIAAI